VELRTFDQTSSAIEIRPGLADRIVSRDAGTSLGDALAEVLEPADASALEAIVVISDGNSTSGRSVAEAARLAREREVPVFAWGVGATDLPDVAIGPLDLPDAAFTDDELRFSATLSSTGLSGRSATVVARLDGTEVAQQSVTLDGSARQTVELSFKPEKAGRRRLDVSVEDLNPSQFQIVENDTTSASLDVVGRKIRVLLVERMPRWEFKYLQAALLRDPRVELKCVLSESDIEAARSGDGPYLASVPSDDAGLALFDLVVLGDVGPDVLTRDRLRLIERFVVELGGGLVVLSGREFMPLAYRGTPLETLLPLEMPSRSSSARPSERTDDGSIVTRSVQPPAGTLRRTRSGIESGILTLEVDSASDERAWQKIPPIRWWQSFGVGKPAAQVLVELAGPRQSLPLIASHQTGLGNVMVIGTDNLWRMRRNVGDRHHARLWGQIITRLTIAGLLDAGKSARLGTDRRDYRPGDRVRLHATLLDDRLRPITASTVGATVESPDGTVAPIRMIARQGVPGAFDAELRLPALGRYRIAVDHPAKPSTFVEVFPDIRELSRVSLDLATLRMLARESGGEVFGDGQMASLPERIQTTRQPMRQTIELPLWSHPLAFLIALVLLSLEWFLRRRWHLK
jgi:hypothetical protein